MNRLENRLHPARFVPRAFNLSPSLRASSSRRQHLTSWRWVFADGRMLKVFGIIALRIIAAFSWQSDVPDRNPPLFLFLLSFLTNRSALAEAGVILDASVFPLRQSTWSCTEYDISFWMGRSDKSGRTCRSCRFSTASSSKHLGEVRIFIQVFNTALFSFTIVLTYLIGGIT